MTEILHLCSPPKMKGIFPTSGEWMTAKFFILISVLSNYFSINNYLRNYTYLS